MLRKKKLKMDNNQLNSDNLQNLGENSQNSPEMPPITPMSSPEPVERSSQTAEPLGRTTTLNSQVAAQNAPSEQIVSQASVKKPQKSHKKWPILVAILVVLALICGGIALMILKPWEQGDQGAQGSDTTQQGEIGAGKTLVELDVNDELVQRLLGYFDAAGNSIFGNIGFGGPLDALSGFYKDADSFNGNLSTVVMIDTALSNIVDYDDEWVNKALVACKMPNDRELILQRYVLNYGLFNGLEDRSKETEDMLMEGAQYNHERGCYDGKTVREKIYEIFGKEIAEFPDLRDNLFVGYDSEYDEFFYWPFAGGGIASTFIIRSPYRATSDGDRIYVEETIAMGNLSDEASVVSLECDLEDTSCSGYYDFKNELASVSSYEEAIELQREFVAEHRSGLSNFRWVFKRTSDGDYVFEKIEKL